MFGREKIFRYSKQLTRYLLNLLISCKNSINNFFIIKAYMYDLLKCFYGTEPNYILTLCDI